MGDSDVKSIVSIMAEFNASFEGCREVRVLVGHPKHSNTSIDATVGEDQLVSADVRNRNLFFHEGSVYPERPTFRVR